MKTIAAVRDDAPRLPPDWLELMRFLAGYYQRPLGETIIGALPPRLRSVKALPRKALSSAQTAGAASSRPPFRPVGSNRLTSPQFFADELVSCRMPRRAALKLRHTLAGNTGRTNS